VANWKLGSNVQKLGVCCPILNHTLSGLYLVKPIDMVKSFHPSPQLASYMDKIRKFEKDMLEKRQLEISQTFSDIIRL
jgi:hypothetical protein